MAEVDEFASSILEEAKRFLEKAADLAPATAGHTAYLHAALNLAFCSLEAHLNSVADEFARHKEFASPHDKGVLLEKEVKLENGAFVLKKLKIYSVVDRIQFMHRRVTGKPLDKTAAWWSALAVATELRNRLTHPKDAPEITLEGVRRAMLATIDAINSVYRAVYQKKFPAAQRELHSSMDF